MEKKMTKREAYNALLKMIDICEAQGVSVEDIEFNDLRAAVENEITLLDNKAAQAKERSEKKKKEGDDLREKILDSLDTESYMIIDDIVGMIGSGRTAQEITPRLAQLISLGQVEKEKVKVKFETEEGTITKTRTGYKRIA